MNIDELTIGDVKSLAAYFQSGNEPKQPEQSPLIGRHVIVRTFSAGVHMGTLLRKEGENVLLRDARRLWKWAGAFTLSEVSQNGVQNSGSRIACLVPMIELTNANEIIPTSEKARDSFEKCHE